MLTGGALSAPYLEVWELGGLVLPLLPHVHKLNIFALHKQASMDNASEAVPSQEGEMEGQ